jgi:hypothetical protein
MIQIQWIIILKYITDFVCKIGMLTVLYLIMHSKLINAQSINSQIANCVENVQFIDNWNWKNFHLSPSSFYLIAFDLLLVFWAIFALTVLKSRYKVATTLEHGEHALETFDLHKGPFNCLACPSLNSWVFLSLQC